MAKRMIESTPITGVFTLRPSDLVCQSNDPKRDIQKGDRHLEFQP
ncbi:hypothetical protein [Leptolyngbya sp. Cla-17]|nr:hypothetical protein [Leptolyngbya sp. Cla-17]